MINRKIHGCLGIPDLLIIISICASVQPEKRLKENFVHFLEMKLLLTFMHKYNKPVIDIVYDRFYKYSNSKCKQSVCLHYRLYSLL